MDPGLSRLSDPMCTRTRHVSLSLKKSNVFLCVDIFCSILVSNFSKSLTFLSLYLG